MPGTSLNHDRVTRNFAVDLDETLEGRFDDCSVSSELIYPIQETAFYSDIAVVCATEPPDRSEGILLVADVVDESSREFDTTARLHCYQSLPALNDYLLLRADAIKVDHYRKTAKGTLDFLQSYTSHSDSVPLTIKGYFFFVPLARIYRQIVFETSTVL